MNIFFFSLCFVAFVVIGCDAANETAAAAAAAPAPADVCVVHIPHPVKHRIKQHYTTYTLADKKNLEVDEKLYTKSLKEPAKGQLKKKIEHARTVAKELKHKYHLSKNGTSAEKAEAYLRTLEGVRWHRHHNRTDVCQLLHGLHHVHIPHKKCHPDTGDKACTGVEAGLRSVWGVKTYKVYHLYALCPVQSAPDAISTLKRKIDAIKVEVAETCGCLKLKCITKKR